MLARGNYDLHNDVFEHNDCAHRAQSHHHDHDDYPVQSVFDHYHHLGGPFRDKHYDDYPSGVRQRRDMPDSEHSGERLRLQLPGRRLHEP